jgi:phosphatidylserine synthase
VSAGVALGLGLLMVSGIRFASLKGVHPLEKSFILGLVFCSAVSIPFIGFWAALFWLQAFYVGFLGWVWPLLRPSVLAGLLEPTRSDS